MPRLRPYVLLGCLATLWGGIPLSAQGLPEDLELPPLDRFLVSASAASGLPMVQPNDNRASAGLEREGVREVSLEVVRAEWRVETAARGRHAYR